MDSLVDRLQQVDYVDLTIAIWGMTRLLRSNDPRLKLVLSRYMAIGGKATLVDRLQHTMKAPRPS